MTIMLNFSKFITDIEILVNIVIDTTVQIGNDKTPTE